MTTTIRNLTQWRPPSGSGYVVANGTENVTTNLGAFLTDNLGNVLVTTPTYTVQKFSTNWSVTGV